MKQLLSTVLAALALAFSAGAYAGNPDLIVNATGTEVRGLDDAMGVRIAVSGNTEVKFQGGSGWLPVADDAAKSKYAKIKAQLITKGALQVGTSSTYFVVPKAISVDCMANDSRVWFANTNSAELISDGCAFRDLVKANAN